MKGRIAQFMERMLEEARKDPTYRKVMEECEGKPRESRIAIRPGPSRGSGEAKRLDY